jgi:hypothetical protein
LVTTAIVSLFIFAGILQADVIFYQGFDYGNADGELYTVGSADWTTSSSVKTLYKAIGMEHEGSPDTGGSAKTKSTWGASESTQDFDDISLIGTNEFWVSCLISCDSATQTLNNSAGLKLSIVENSWGGIQSYVVEKNYNYATGYFFSKSGSGAGITNATFAIVGTDTTRIVFHVKKSTIPEIWINPTSEPVIGTGQSIGNATTSNLTSINKLEINSLGLVINMDEIVIGETYADVCAPPPQGTILVIQ